MPRQAAAEGPQRNLTLSRFEKLPTEILVEIAKHLQDDANFPHIGPPLEYISAESVTENYWSQDALSYRPSEQRKELWEELKRRNQDIRNLTATSSHLSAACGRVIYRQVIPTRYDEVYGKFFERITLDPLVQTYIQHLSIQISPSPYLQRFISLNLEPDLLDNLINLRSLEIRGVIGAHNDKWYRLIPRLPSLERLSMTGAFTTHGFPLLPNLREAYFNNCYFDPLIAEHILSRLPSLKLLSNYSSCGQMPRNAFLGLWNTLETLAWIEYAADPSHMAPAISGMKVLKHIKTNSLQWLLPVTFGMLQNFYNLSKMLGM